VSPSEDTWLKESGASKHMIGQRDILSCLTEKKFDKELTFYLSFREERLQSCLHRWRSSYVPKGKTMEEAIVIGKEEGRLYKLKGC
jgi:hypothetical protein